MLKFLLHITFVFALLTQQLQLVVVCVAFKMEQNHLIQNTCINRHNPNNKCKAHCQLSKRISDQERQEQQNKIPLKEQNEFAVRFETLALKVSRQETRKRIWRKAYAEKLRTGVLSEQIQPPEYL